MKRTHIVAAIILNPNQSKIYITKRPTHLHQGGFWEFPGGKVESGETIQQAMARELYEEIGIEVVTQAPYQHFQYDYPDKALVFDFMLVTDFLNQPYGKEDQEGEWVEIGELSRYEFPAANVAVVEKVVSDFISI
jgi:8-oxo-dGTP diphosphatase